PRPGELRSRFVTARLERDPARAARQGETVRRYSEWQELELQPQALPELGRHVDADGKPGRRFAERKLEHCVEETLVPEKIGVGRQARSLEMRARRVIVAKRRIREQGDARVARDRCELRPIRAQLDLPGACRCHRLQALVDASEVQ